MYTNNSQTKFKSSMVKSSLCDHSDAYIHVQITITVPKTGTAAVPNNRNMKVICKTCAQFTDSISEIHK